MPEKSFLSIVTPTRGNFSDYWLEQLLNVRGDLEFVLVYYPGVPIKAIADTRVKTIVSPYKGEMMQRFLGFLNATGEYVLALDDDDFVHPNILELAKGYFQKFPESWVLRLKSNKIDQNEPEKVKAEWPPIPDLNSLKVLDRSTPETRSITLQTITIAPLENALDWRLLIPFIGLFIVFLDRRDAEGNPITKRRDARGPHIENFNNKIWNNSMLQQILPEISRSTKILGSLTWVPSSAFDRLVGLFFQAYFYQKESAIGHWMPDPEQIRFVDKDPKLKPPRFHVASDFLLIKYFPQYGYFWNLFLFSFYGSFRALGKLMKWKLTKKKVGTQKINLI
ncbi:MULTISPECIES: glycosyltransferase family A protein [Spirulina sp. CCY15215]|uniref:glycosyltransferase family A protein n=1 Tax=Spirulina sp. CCY15215 TaxID=2767591 RepID=UPI001951C5D8|nr:glycosyltransferase family A protein [Spirulina major]